MLRTLVARPSAAAGWARRGAVGGDRRELLRRFHGHLHDVWCRLARSIPEGWVEQASGLTCIATGSTSPTFNLALSGEGLRDPRVALDAAHDRFREAGLRWLLKLQTELDHEVVVHARRRGLDLDEEPVYGMPIRPWAVTAALMSASPLSIGVAGRDTINDAVHCFADAFDADPNAVSRELGPNLLTIPTFTVFVGYLSGEPVATSMLATTRSVGLAGVYSVATRPAYRGRGFGTALTAVALAAAGEQGFDTAVLEPSPSGAPMYRRMGFAPRTSYLEAVISPLHGS
jgi:ribosomal protein S18 acetylase RimI-like enzyme